MPEEEDDDWGSDSDLSADDAYASSWSVKICYYGPKQDSFRTTQGLPSKILDTTWSASCLDTLIERIGFELHIPDIAPVGMSHPLQQRLFEADLICKWKLAMLLAVQNNRSIGRFLLSYAFARPPFFTQLNATRCSRFLRKPHME